MVNVFSTFHQPYFKQVRQNPDVNFRILLPDSATPKPLVFTRFSEPFFRKHRPELSPEVVFRVLRPTAATPTSLVFSKFSEPIKATFKDSGVRSSFFVAPVVSTVTPTFSTFDFLKTKYTLGSFSNSPVVLSTQNYVFSPFEQPQFKATQRGSFTNTVFVPSVVTFTGFMDFGAPLPRRLQNHHSVTYEIVAPTVAPEVILLGGKRWIRREPPKVLPVASSTIEEVSYDKHSNELNVKFKSGKVYNYANIGEKKVKGLVRAKSSGKYLHNNIKGKYFTNRIK